MRRVLAAFRSRRTANEETKSACSEFVLRQTVRGETKSVCCERKAVTSPRTPDARRRKIMKVERLNKAELLRLKPAQALAVEGWPDEFAVIGNQQLLTKMKTAVLGSRQCPGTVILRLYELAQRLRERELTFIGGFHTPAERDFLHYLLAGSCQLIVCPARSLTGMRLSADWQKAIAAERMLLLSPFTAVGQTRQSARFAERRNDFVLSLAEQILLLHAAPGSRTEAAVTSAQQQGKPCLTLENDDETIAQHLTLKLPTHP